MNFLKSMFKWSLLLEHGQATRYFEALKYFLSSRVGGD